MCNTERREKNGSVLKKPVHACRATASCCLEIKSVAASAREAIQARVEAGTVGKREKQEAGKLGQGMNIK